MRASRVSMAASSTYRRAKRYIEKEEAFTILQDENALAHFNQQQQQQNKKKKPAPKKQVLVQKKHHVLLKGMLFEADSVAQVRNQLLHRALSVSYINNLKKRNHTYKTSI